MNNSTLSLHLILSSFFLNKKNKNKQTTGIPGLAQRVRQLTGNPGPYRPAAEHTA